MSRPKAARKSPDALPALRAFCVPLSAPWAAGQLPDEIVGLRWGRNETAKGAVTVDEQSLKALTLSQAAAGFDHVAIDFEHNSIPQSPTYLGEPVRLAARRSLPEVEAGLGLIYRRIEWLDAARGHAADYPDFSAAILLDAAGRVVFVHSGALCRNGAAAGIGLWPESADPARIVPAATLTALSAALAPVIRLRGDIKPIPPKHPDKSTTMIDPAKLRTLLKLHADATDEETAAALDTAVEQLSAAPTAPAAPAAAPDNQAGDGNAALAVLAADVQTLRAELEDERRQRIAESAAAEGKIVPRAWVEGDARLTPAQLAAEVAKLPVTVPIGARAAAGAVATLSAGIALTDEQRSIAKKFGVSEKAFKRQLLLNAGLPVPADDAEEK
jgi:phage I-like protein